MKWQLSWKIPGLVDFFVFAACLGFAQITGRWIWAGAAFFAYSMAWVTVWVLHERYIDAQNGATLARLREELETAKEKLDEFMAEAGVIVGKAPAALSAVNRFAQTFHEEYPKRLARFECQLAEAEKKHAKGFLAGHLSAGDMFALSNTMANDDYKFVREFPQLGRQELNSFQEAEVKAKFLAKEVIRNIDNLKSTEFLRRYGGTSVDWPQEVVHLLPIFRLLETLEAEIVKYRLYDVPHLTIEVRAAETSGTKRA